MEQLLYRNNKTGNLYRVIGTVTNTTNAQDGQIMYLYKSVNNGMSFVREVEEFKNKFTLLQGSKYNA